MMREVPSHPADPHDLDADARANDSATARRIADDLERSPADRLRLTLDASATLLKLANAPRSGGSTRA
jgi:hypothetical protein